MDEIIIDASFEPFIVRGLFGLDLCDKKEQFSVSAVNLDFNVINASC